MNVEIPFSGDQHKQILSALLSRYDMAQKEVAKKDSAWRTADDLFAAYIPKTDADLLRKSNYTKGKPDFTTVVVPYGYAVAMSGHTYQTSVFLSRNPVMQYTGRHGEAAEKSLAVEAIIDYQVNVGEMMVPLYHWLLDPWKYGYGIVSNWWEEETRTISDITEAQVKILGIPIPGKTQKVRSTKQIRGYTGNKLLNYNPRNWFSDPAVSLVNFQLGEYCGHITTISLNDMVAGELDGTYYNTKFIEDADHNTTLLAGSQDNSESRGNIPTKDNPYLGSTEFPNGMHGIIEMTIKLIPSKWKLGTGDRPEKWVFTIADRKAIIRSRPRGELHDKFPYFIQQYDINGYDYTSRGMMEMIDPMNNVLSWLINARLANVRSSLANQWLIDPSKISMTDFERGGPGLAVRLKPQAYGTDIRTALMQFPVMDVTQGNLTDFKVMVDIIQRTFGVTDNALGAVNMGGRKTATEIRSANTFSINRLKTQAEYNSALGWSPLAQVLLQNSQQYYDDTIKVKIVGDLINTLSNPSARYLDVSPEDIAGFFDFVPVDGTMPIDRYAQAMLWKDMIFGMMKVPVLAQSYDVPRLFNWVGRLAGLKEISKFQVKIMPNQSVQELLAQGKLVPPSTAVGDIQSASGQVPQVPAELNPNVG